VADGRGPEGAQRSACVRKHHTDRSGNKDDDDTVTWLSNDIDPDTPAGLCKAFGIGAEICLSGAKKLDPSSSGWDLPDRQILAFHALELALKAFLAKHGLTRVKLRKKPYGHDLDRLYSEAVKRRLSLPPRSKELIAEINEYHNTQIIRYEFAKTRTVPTCKMLFPIVEAILAACK
jgi:HEPN domain-containing protein